MTIRVYGIANCDSVKKVRAWLDQQGRAYAFHDYKKLGVPEAQLRCWVAAHGWETLINRKGTTWRALADSSKAAVVDAESAVAVMLANPSAIKRPVVTCGERVIVGVDISALESLP